jgi:hypothetical protein
LLFLIINVIFVKKDMSTKEQVIQTVQKMPQDVPIDEILDELIFIKKVQKGLAQSEGGQINTTEQAKKKLAKWLK